jgi:ketosteroid isomerase-like protein
LTSNRAYDLAMDAAALNDLADRLFDAFVAHDLDTVETMMAPHAMFAQNGNSMTFAEARALIEGLTAVLGDHRYEEVHRVVGDRAIVEEHRVRSTTPGGHDVDLAACVVIRVDDEGKIVSLDEYVDPTPLTATLG